VQVERVIVVDFLQGGAKVGLLILLFFWSETATSAAWAIFGAYGLAMVLAGTFVQGLKLRPTFRVQKTDIYKVVNYSLPLLVGGLGYFLARHIDRLMLGWLTDSTAVGVYAIASKLATLMKTPQRSLISIFKPIASESHRKDAPQRMRTTYLFVSKWGGAINGMALLTFAGAGYSLLELFGTEYASNTTYYALVMLAVLYYVETWAGPKGPLLQMSDNHRVEALNVGVFIIADLSLNYVLIPIYGVIGASFATLLAGAIRNMVQLAQVWWLAKVTPFVSKNIMAFCIVAIGTAMSVLGSGYVRAFFAAGGATILMTFVIWTASYEEREGAIRIGSNVLGGEV
jgi:O-antigen/teichoic acid export membrane protein